MRMTMEMKNKYMSQRQQAYEEDQERRRINVIEALAKKKKERNDKFEQGYLALKEEFEDLVQGHIDPKLDRYESLKNQGRKEMHTEYTMEVTQKMHQQVMRHIQDMKPGAPFCLASGSLSLSVSLSLSLSLFLSLFLSFSLSRLPFILHHLRLAAPSYFRRHLRCRRHRRLRCTVV